MVKTAIKYKSKKNELVEIAEKLFLEKGYEETSIEDILKASGLSKGGFYHYFKSKEEVLAESINNFAESLLKELEPIIEDQGLNALEKLNRFMEKKIAFQKPRKELIKYLFMVMKSDFSFYKYCLIIAQKYVDPFTRIIEQGAKEGIFKVEFPRETADILLRAVTSVPQSISFREYIEDKTKSLKYKASMEAIIARALGIDCKEIRIF
ncbi:TetR/AcrR family transcriptional regulator [Desulfosporosinus nitroreducens]|uniref:TetR/AcrR family transcriptional regulator n=1 Tax=Desulfosporosinus nitroreducens TaxID=2018668 RepID=A0ABT8QN37_9FIRM|nr:TetR/AcrR family transcriptional regulator [Desulfosporosinus nitroreducens]MCO1603311.1 TetR/AcrR family transcriptional regulator [Desulfosporosinus nitroreducens]MDO0822716.1 TetR/AcrR family transcriptional regulator [Desulfosporosinus nitroreducens]